MLDNRNIRTFPPDFQLVDCRRTEGIRRRQKYGFPVLLEIMRQLADGRCLADTIYTNDQQNGRRGQIFVLLRALLQNRRNLINQHILDYRRVGRMLSLNPFSQVFHDIHCCLHAHIRHDKCFFQFLKQILINLRKRAQNAIHTAKDVLSCLIQTCLQLCKKAHLRRLFLLRAFLRRCFLCFLCRFLLIQLFCNLVRQLLYKGPAVRIIVRRKNLAVLCRNDNLILRKGLFRKNFPCNLCQLIQNCFGLRRILRRQDFLSVRVLEGNLDFRFRRRFFCILPIQNILSCAVNLDFLLIHHCMDSPVHILTILHIQNNIRILRVRFHFHAIQLQNAFLLLLCLRLLLRGFLLKKIK